MYLSITLLHGLIIEFLVLDPATIVFSHGFPRGYLISLIFTTPMPCWEGKVGLVDDVPFIPTELHLGDVEGQLIEPQGLGLTVLQV